MSHRVSCMLLCTMLMFTSDTHERLFAQYTATRTECEGGTHPGNQPSDNSHHQRELQPCCPVPAWQMGTWTHLRCLGRLETFHRCWPFRSCPTCLACTSVFIMHQYQGLLAPKILHFCVGGRSCMSTQCTTSETCSHSAYSAGQGFTHLVESYR